MVMERPRAGAMDKQVTIQQLSDTAGASGYPVEDWTDLFVGVWMERLDVTGSERFRAAQLSAPIETRWRMYYMAEMAPDLVDVPKKRRLVYSGRVYDITSAIEIGRKNGVELTTLASSEVAP